MPNSTQLNTTTTNPETANAKTEEDWSHIRETITMLYLAVCQIKMSLGDGDHSIIHLTDSFTQLATHSNQVDQQVRALTSNNEDLVQIQTSVTASTEAMQEKISEAITAFQFYDRISQRLDHVSDGLEQLTGLMDNTQQLHNPQAWLNLQDGIKDSYSMESERIMFEHILRGASVKEALEVYQHHFDIEAEKCTDSDDDEVEFF